MHNKVLVSSVRSAIENGTAISLNLHTYFYLGHKSFSAVGIEVYLAISESVSVSVSVSRLSGTEA